MPITYTALARPLPQLSQPQDLPGLGLCGGGTRTCPQGVGKWEGMEGMCKTRTLSPPDTDSGMASKHTATHTHAWDTSPQCHRTGLGSARTQTCTHGHMHTPRRLMT